MARRAWTALWMALALLWAAVGRAGVDGHGAAPFPDDGDAADPIWGWHPEVARPGVPSFGVTLEGALSPLVRESEVGGEVLTEVLLGDYVALDLAGTVGIARRVAIGATLPVFLASGHAEHPGRPALGDLVLVAPVGLLLPRDDGTGFGVGISPVLRLPTGNASRWVGDGGFGGGASLAAGWGGGRAHVAGSIGVDARRWNTLPDDPARGAVLGTADLSVAVHVARGVAVHIEGRATTPPVPDAPAPVEALLGARGTVRRGVWWVAGVGTGLTNGPTAAALRGYAGFGFTPPRPVAWVDAPPVVPEAVERILARVHVQDPAGEPVADASVSWRSDGRAHEGDIAPLEPGTWTVEVAADGFGAQTRDLTLAAGDPAVDLDVVLAPVAGDASLALSVVGSDSAPVEDAAVRIDGAVFGTTSSLGTMGLGGLEPGSRTLEIAAEAWLSHEERVTLAAGDNAVSVVLAPAPGSVRVVVRGPDGPVSDALVRFDGPSRLPPIALGDDGERVVQVRPGEWRVLVLSPSYGLQSRDIVVPEDGAVTLVEVFLRPEEGGEADLVVRVVDPDGRSVGEADVILDGRTLGRTSSGGTVAIERLAVGPRVLTVRRDWFRDEPPIDLFLVAGVQEKVVTMEWLPGTVRVTARGPDGPVDDAVARFSGSAAVDTVPLGPSGQALASLPAGSWRVLVVSERWGLQEREVLVPPDTTTRLDVDVVLGGLPSGPADLVVVVTNPDGRAVADALVSVDGTLVGATSTAGTVRLDQIALGERTITVVAPAYAAASVPIFLIEGEQTAFASLKYAPGATRVITRTKEGPVTDAVLRLSGTTRLPPLTVDRRGERLVALSPGRWQALAVSPTYGLVEERFTVREGEADLRVVELILEPVAEGTTSLVLRVEDPDGRPIEGAVVSRDGAALATTAAGGAALLEGFLPGPISVRIDAPGFEPDRLGGVLREGAEERLVVLRYTPRSVVVDVLDTDGSPLRASVSAEGPMDVPRALCDEAGRAVLELRPGTWQIVAAASGRGSLSQPVTVVVGADPGPLRFVLGGSLVDLTAESVLIREKVHFDFDRDTIRPESGEVLAQVAATLLGQPGLARVEVQGHTDGTGGAAYNLDLSERRARAVVAALVALGVAPERLVGNGYGQARPITAEDDESARAENRRVQFEILEWTPNP